MQTVFQFRVDDSGPVRQSVEQHPDKTFIGYTERGFNFLGYEFNQNGLIGMADIIAFN